MSRSAWSGNGRFGVGLSATLCALVALALCPSPAAAFKLAAKFSNPDIARAQGLAVDRRGDMFVTEPERIPGAGFNTVNATKVVELSPTGKRIRTILSHFVVHGQLEFMRGQVAVTPNGREVFIGGSATPDGSSLTPFLAGFSTATGKFIRGTEFDQQMADFGGAIAVDPTGTHVYVVDQGGYNAPQGTLNRILEFNTVGLGQVGVFTLHGSAAPARVGVSAIAVGGPNNDLFADVDPGHGGSFIQMYGSDGTFIRQVAAPRYSGVAVNPAGYFFAGGRRGFDVHRPDGRFREPGIGTAGPVSADAVNSSDDLFGFQAGSRHRPRLILKFVPLIPKTRIVGEPAPPLVVLLHSPTARFRFKSPSFGSTFECRLLRRGFDAVAFSRCSSPQTYLNTPNGVYAFEVRAVSSDGAPDPSPAVVRFNVVVKYAHAVITAHPPKLIGRTRATFKFKSGASGATFQCRLTRFLRVPRAFKPCSSPVTYHGLTHDVYSFQVQAITRRGFVEPGAATFVFAVDPRPPVVTAPVVSIAQGQQVGLLGQTSLAVGWSASDPNTPGGALLDSLQERSTQSGGGFGAWSTVPGEDRIAGHTATYVPTTPGTGAHQFRALAENNLHVVGTSPPGNPLRLSLIDSNDPALSYTTGWATIADSHAVGGSVAVANTAGARVTLHFTGSSIAVIGVPAPQRGVIRVCVDPGTSSQHCSSVDTNASSKTQRDLIYARNGLSNMPHTIVLTTKTTPVVLDGFIVMS